MSISDEQKERLEAEYKELNDRAGKLLDFIEINDKFNDLDDEMQFLLEAQYRAMVDYSHILYRRMTLLGIEA